VDVACGRCCRSWQSREGFRLSALGSRLSALGSQLSALGSRLSAFGSGPVECGIGVVGLRPRDVSFSAYGAGRYDSASKNALTDGIARGGSERVSGAPGLGARIAE